MKRTYSGIKKKTYQISYRKDGNFKWRDWLIRIGKVSYGWGLLDLEHKTPNPSYRSDRWYVGFEYDKEPLPREIILKIESILRGLDSGN